MPNYTLNHLEELEAEVIFVIREVVANFENPALLFSEARTPFYLLTWLKKPFIQLISFPLIHVDTGHNFPKQLSLGMIL